MKTTEKYNILIAKFMGGIYSPSKFFISSWDIPDMDGYQHVLFYDSSWDWLMPVIDKIESLDIRGNGYDFPKVKLNGDHCEIFAYATYRGEAYFWKKWPSITGTFHNHPNQINSKIEATYLAVVEFIKWYNKQKK